MTTAQALSWRSLLDGRLLLAAANKGFYELRMGDRVLYTSFAGGALLVTDLGPCHQARMEECKDLCERHSRRAHPDALSGYELLAVQAG